MSRVTRSAARGISSSGSVPQAAGVPEALPGPVKRKRKNQNQELENKTKKARVATSESADQQTILQTAIQAPVTLPLLPPVLSFSFQDAKKHLIGADPRFAELFSKLPCRPYENLERVEPFRTLASSILSQQISWLAARSITHRFKRLFNPSLQEVLPPPGETNPDDPSADYFPSPEEVVVKELAVLRTAGLSQRKAEYVQDLAARFADGRLSASKLSESNDEELAQMLIEVRGIGRWTVDMFAIFSLRRPDILPVGDLGVQKGLLRWILSRHAPGPDTAIRISPKKLSETAEDDDETDLDESSLPVSKITGTSGIPSTPIKPPADVAAVTGIPPPFTPSINRVLESPIDRAIPPLPKGLSVTELKARSAGKKKIKGGFLGQSEMEDLTESWKPYRSLGVYYMWSLAETEVPKAKKPAKSKSKASA